MLLPASSPFVSAAAMTAATAAAWLSLLRGVGDRRGEGPAEPAQVKQHGCNL